MPVSPRATGAQAPVIVQQLPELSRNSRACNCHHGSVDFRLALTPRTNSGPMAFQRSEPIPSVFPSTSTTRREAGVNDSPLASAISRVDCGRPRRARAAPLAVYSHALRDRSHRATAEVELYRSSGFLDSRPRCLLVTPVGSYVPTLWRGAPRPDPRTGPPSHRSGRRQQIRSTWIGAVPALRQR